MKIHLPLHEQAGFILGSVYLSLPYLLC